MNTYFDDGKHLKKNVAETVKKIVFSPDAPAVENPGNTTASHHMAQCADGQLPQAPAAAGPGRRRPQPPQATANGDHHRGRDGDDDGTDDKGACSVPQF